jgi:hypothetical protein
MRIFPPVKEATVITLPAPKPEILARRAEIIAALCAIMPGDGVIAEGIRLKPYETDGLAAYRQMPLAVVLPSIRATAMNPGDRGSLAVDSIGFQADGADSPVFLTAF